jgi:DNA-binding response OmpR family regulator
VTVLAATGEQGLIEALNERNPPMLILLDLMLPGMSGTELCRRFRREPSTRRTPIIILTAKGSESDRVAGLDLGADDYITKPFSVRELLARVRAVLRRMDEGATKTYEDDRLMIDFADIRVVCDGRKIKLTNKEFTLLSVLAKSADRVVTRQQLLDNVWGYSYYGDARTLDVHIRRLRQKLEECGNCIETIVGVGYRFTGCSEKPEGN